MLVNGKAFEHRKLHGYGRSIASVYRPIEYVVHFQIRTLSVPQHPDNL